MRIELEYATGADGRPQGSLKAEAETAARPFTGTIQLLRLLEDLVREGATE